MAQREAYCKRAARCASFSSSTVFIQRQSKYCWKLYVSVSIARIVQQGKHLTDFLSFKNSLHSLSSVVEDLQWAYKCSCSAGCGSPGDANMGDRLTCEILIVFDSAQTVTVDIPTHAHSACKFQVECDLDHDD